MCKRKVLTIYGPANEIPINDYRDTCMYTYYLVIIHIINIVIAYGSRGFKDLFLLRVYSQIFQCLVMNSLDIKWRKKTRDSPSILAHLTYMWNISRSPNVIPVQEGRPDIFEITITLLSQLLGIWTLTFFLDSQDVQDTISICRTNLIYTLGILPEVVGKEVIDFLNPKYPIPFVAYFIFRFCPTLKESGELVYQQEQGI